MAVAPPLSALAAKGTTHGTDVPRSNAKVPLVASQLGAASAAFVPTPVPFTGCPGSLSAPLPAAAPAGVHAATMPTAAVAATQVITHERRIVCLLIVPPSARLTRG